MLFRSSTLISNQWNHVAVYRSGSSWYIAVNGSVQNVATSSNSVIDNSGPFIIGGYSDASSQKGYPITGRMSNLRYVVGSSVYGASNFTPPTSALTAISGTQLLTLQNSSIVDNSANSLTITQVNGSYPVTTTSSSSIGYLAYNANDTSGNANNWLTINMNVATSSATTYDAMIDSPTNASASGTQPVGNYATLNPLALGTDATLSNANLTISYGTGASGQKSTPATIAASSGKWYYEFVVTTSSVSPVRAVIGVQSSSMPTTEFPGYGDPNAWGMYLNDGNKYNNNTSGGVAYGSSFAVNDIAMCAFDLDNGKIWWGKNGTWFASGDPAAGTNAAFTDRKSTRLNSSH